MSVASELVAGGVAGATGILATQPMDTIRIRLQSSAVQLGLGARYTGVLDCARSTLRKEGVRGLYKGFASPCMTVSFMNALLFFSYEYAGKATRIWSGRRPEAELSLLEVYLAGACSGLGSAFVTGPTELVKCLAQTNLKNKGRVSEEWAIFRNLVKRQGWLAAHGPTRGLATTIARDTPSYGIYFLVYEAGTRYVGKSDASSFVFGGLAGAVAWASIYPLDVLKTRWQTAEPGRYASVRHCFREVRAEEGYRTFFRGFNATMVRAIPQNGVVFVVYEMVKSMFPP